MSLKEGGRRGVIYKPLFPELLDPEPKTPFCSSIARGNHDSEMILVHHLRETAVPFARSVAEGYKIRKIIGIPYSADQNVVEVLSRSFEVTVPKSLSDIKHLVRREVGSSNNTVVIEEIGGYTTEIIKFLDDNRKVVGVVEDTNQGHWLWQKAKIDRLPVMSVAQSELKKNENPFVGKSIIENAARYLEELGLQKLDESIVLVLGYGNIGQSVAKYIEPLCKKLFVYDTDPNKLAAAAEQYNALRNLTEADVIIGTTGSAQHSVNIEDVKLLKSGVILISGSSKKVEFDLDRFERASDRHESIDDTITYYIGNKKILVANSGEPINFRTGSLPSKVLDLVYGSLIYCANLLDKRMVGAGLHELSDTAQGELTKKYLEIYKAKSLEDVFRK